MTKFSIINVAWCQFIYYFSIHCAVLLDDFHWKCFRQSFRSLCPEYRTKVAFSYGKARNIQIVDELEEHFLYEVKLYRQYVFMGNQPESKYKRSLVISVSMSSFIVKNKIDRNYHKLTMKIQWLENNDQQFLLLLSIKHQIYELMIHTLFRIFDDFPPRAKF